MNGNLDRAPMAMVDSERVWQWQLAQQGLVQGFELPNLQAVSDRALGLHAARVASPYATAAARLATCAPLAGLLGELGDPHLVTIRCMRKTLHTLPVDLASWAHGATRSYRIGDVHARMRRAGLNSTVVAAGAASIVEYLAQHPGRSARQIEDAVETRGLPVSAVRLGLKLLWERGDATYRNCAVSWHRQQRRFSLREQAHPGFLPDVAEELAAEQLVVAYFRRYGPATLKDASWWSGLGQSRIVSALNKHDVVQVPSEWAASPHYMLAESLEDFRSIDSTLVPGGPQLLAHEDVALKAYFESRRRYLGRVPANAVFNSIGEVRPTIIFDGRIVGLWSWRAATQTVICHFLPGYAAARARAVVRSRALVMERWLRAGYSDLRGAAVSP